MKLNDLKKYFVMMVGLPGSGKSTLISQLKQQLPYVIVSTDDIFEQLGKQHGLNYNQAFKQFDYKQIEKQMFDELKDALKAGKNVIVDQTNLTTKSRAKKLALVPKDYYKIAYVFEIDEDELKKRLQKRQQTTGKHIPEDVILQMKKSYQQPSKSEGFDEIKIIK